MTIGGGDGETLIPLRVRIEEGHRSSPGSGAARDAVLQFECNWDVGIGGSVWTSGEILTAHLASQQHSFRPLFKDKVVVELGSGTGFVGLMTAVCFEPALVLVTDLASHVECMQKNIDRNLELYNRGVNVRAAELSWGVEDQARALLQSLGAERKVDIILGTDVAYLRELYEPLLQTLRSLTNESTLVILGMNRTDTDIKFFQRLEEEGFEYYKIQDRLMPAEYKGKDFGIFEINRRRIFSPIVKK